MVHKFFCQNCNGKKYWAKWTNAPYYIPTYLGEIDTDGDFIYRPPTKCKVCKRKTVFIKGNLDVELEPGEIIQGVE